MGVMKVHLRKLKLNVIKRAADILRAGGVIIYPTDTAYGLGVDALNDNAIKKLYRIKGRDFSKPTHVIVPNWSWIMVLTYPNENAKKLYEAFMPGPLTIVLNKKPVTPDILTADLPTLGIRIPNNDITKLISRFFNAPYTTPSANKSGGKTPYSIEDVKEELDISKVDLILDAGKLPELLPSTIVDISITPPKILRKGLISEKNIEEVLG